MIDGLSILLKLVALGLLLSLVIVYLPLPAATYRPLLVIWKVLRYRPGIIIALRRRAADAFSHDQFATAIQFSREALRRGLLRPLSDVPFDVFTCAIFLQRSDQLAAAAEWFLLADDTTRDDFRLKPSILIGLGSCLTQLGRYDEAESALERATTLYTDVRTLKYWHQVTYARGYLAMSLERFEDALRWYESLESLPTGTRRYQRLARLANLNNLAAASFGLGDLANAERYVNEAQRLGGSEAWRGKDYFLNTRGALRLAQGRIAEARADFNEVLRVRGADTHTLWFLAQASYKEGSFEDASAYIDKITKPPREHLWRRRLAETLESLAQYDVFAGRPEMAERRRAEADNLRTTVKDPNMPSTDPLLVTVRSALGGRRFIGIPDFEVLAVRTYLAAFLLLVGAILFLPSGSVSVVLLEVALLTFFVTTRWPWGRWLLWSKTVAGP
jgi:tetratricopeptide (TPR) repeat protein